MDKQKQKIHVLLMKTTKYWVATEIPAFLMLKLSF